MRRFSGTRFVFITLIALALAVTGCSDDDASQLVAGDGDSVAGGATESASSGDADAGESAVADDSAPAAIVRTTTTTTTVPTTEQPVETTTTVALAPDLEYLGESHASSPDGFGGWAVDRSDADPNSESECQPGTLVFLINGAVVHRYDDLAFNGGIRHYLGVRGQEAFVVNCEESVEAVWTVGTPLLPEAGYPELETFPMLELADGDAFFSFNADWDFRDAIFAGYGWIGDTYDLWTFGVADDGVTPRVVALAELVGERQPLNETLGVSVVVPNGWTYESTDEYELLKNPNTFSRVQIFVEPTSIDAPLAEGDDQIGSFDTTTITWVNANDLLVGQESASIDYDFRNEQGVRTVRHITLFDRTVVIEVFSDDADSNLERAQPSLALELVRVFE